MVDQSHVFLSHPTPLFLWLERRELLDVVSEESFAKRKKEKVFQIYLERQGKWDGVCFGYHEVRTVKCVVSIPESKGGVFFFR